MTDFETAAVNVPQPSGTVNINANGTHDVSQYATAEVAVSGWSTDEIAQNNEPSGAITLGNTVTEVATYAFYKKPITNVTGASVTKINKAAFRDTALTSCSFPNVTYIDDEAFYDSDLATTVFPSVVQIDTEAFRGTEFTEVTDTQFPNFTTSVGNAAFGNMKKIIKVFLSKIKSTNEFMFDACDLLERAVFPILHTFGRGTFRNCQKLTVVDWRGDHTAATRINQNTFLNCAMLTTVILGGNRIPVLDLSAFNGTPFANGGAGGTIYIPKEFYDHLGDGTSLDYKAASNWSTLDGYGTVTWACIEGSYYETHYADGTVIS